MNGYVLNDDRRLSYTEIELINQGVHLYDTLKWAKDLDFILFGFNGLNESLKGSNHGYFLKLDEEFFKNIHSNTIIYTGKKCLVLEKLQKKYGFKLVTLLEEEDILKKNATLTAEGLLCEILLKRPFSLEEASICIIGYGYCGKAIANKLIPLVKSVKIIETHPKVRQEVINDGLEIICDKELMDASLDIIINTAPTHAIDEHVLKQLDSTLYLFDISSFPYGYHHECASHVHDYILPALPSVYGYKSAGKMLADYILKRGITCLQEKELESE